MVRKQRCSQEMQTQHRHIQTQHRAQVMIKLAAHLAEMAR